MDIVIKIFGGLGLFLYGMNLMGEGLQKSAGAKLKNIIELLTSNIVMGVIVGAIVTVLIQSSSATTVMVVGFVNAGIMSLTQAVGVIMGANIGTTVTAQLVSLEVDLLAPISLGVGIIIYMFSKKTKTRYLAEILIGFGILFTGMDFMKEAVSPLREYKGFTDMLVSFGTNPLLGVLMGFSITVLVQSSSASMGILLALASEGLIPIYVALPILYGENIGTCVTSLLSSIGASKNAKRAAIMHLIFNVLGTLIFMIFLSAPIVYVVTYLNPNDYARQIANAHTLFNILNVILLLPFNKFIVDISLRIIPDGINDDDDDKIIKFIDYRMIETPSIALLNTLKETSRMSEKAMDSLKYSMEGLFEESTTKIEKSFKREKLVDELQRNIINYLMKLSKSPINDDDTETVDALFNVVNDIERIGDHSENIAEIAKSMIENSFKFSDDANKELKVMYEKVLSTYSYSINSMKNSDIDLALKIIKMEEQVDAIQRLSRKNHMIRLSENICDIESGILYLDIMVNLERISDHSLNIVQQVISKRIFVK
ncbi:MAG: Na/Pi cotransporter family protein [Peptostreptococcaceae bacterium]